MPTTPINNTAGRITRSGSNAANITLLDIKTIVENSTSDIKNEIGKLNSTIRSLIARVDELETRNSQLEDKCKRIEEQCSSGLLTDKAADSLCNEVFLRKKKEKYLVISGLSEATSGSVAERRSIDEDNIKDIAASLGIGAFSVSNVTRIGRGDGITPRLTRFKCSDKGTRADLLRKAKELRSIPKYSRTFISPDLTKLQLQEAKILQTELKRRREAGEQVVIFRGRVVRRESLRNAKPSFRE